MCGIVAAFTSNGDARLAARMVEEAAHAIAHRGSEPLAIHIDARGYAVACKRLPLVGGESGRQPLLAKDERFVAVMNGEFYDFKRFHPAGHSDTASFVRSFVDGGYDWLNMADWDGAACVVDRREGRVYLLRDHLGIRPLYWSRSDRYLLVASELKALSVLPRASVLRPVPPGCALELTLPSLAVQRHRWWVPRRRPCDVQTTGIRDELIRAVENRVPQTSYALALSGGVDSSIVLAIAAHLQRPPSVAIVVGTPSSDDVHHATHVANHFGIPLTVVPPRPIELLQQELPSIVARSETWEYQIINHFTPTAQVARAARLAGTEVVLTGEGADELFCGYSCDLGNEAPRRARRIRELHRTNCRRIDRAGYSESVEMRAPFLAQSVVRATNRIPATAWARRTNNGATKPILRALFRRELPKEVLYRPKLPFARGAGYVYGHGSERPLIPAPPKLHIAPSWARLARSHSELGYLEYFLGCGYGRAEYLRARSL